MRVGEAHPFGGEPIQMRRRNPGVRVVTPQIAVAQVVGEDDDDVGLTGGRCRLRHRAQRRQAQESERDATADDRAAARRHLGPRRLA
jgi:hypothetical protein